MSTEAWTEPEKLLREWERNAAVARGGHRITSKHLSSRHRCLGAIQVGVSVFLGSSLVAVLKKFEYAETVALALGAGVLILSAIQTLDRAHERAETHESLRAGFASLCRQISTILAVSPDERGSPKDVLDRVRARYDELASVHAPIPERFWKQAKKELGGVSAF